MNSHYNPLYVGVAAGIFEVLFQVVELLAPQRVGVLRGEVHNVNLCKIKGKPKVGLVRGQPGQNVPFHVGSIVIESLVVAYSRHKWGIGCEFLCKFSEEIPNWLQLSRFLVTHTRIGNIPSEENKVVRFYEVVFRNLIYYKCTKRCVCSHIAKDSHIYLFKGLYSKGRGLEVFRFRENSRLLVSHSIIVPFQRLKVLYDCAIYSAMEPQMTNIISSPIRVGLPCEQSWKSTILNDRFVVELRSGDPHNLHLVFFVSKPYVDLLRTSFYCDPDLRNLDQFLQGNLVVEVGIEKIKNGRDIFFCDIVFLFHKSEVCEKFLESGMSILILIISSLPKGEEVVHGDFCLCQGKQGDDKKDSDQFNHNNIYYLQFLSIVI